MADIPQIQLDINEILADFAIENAKLAQRAVLAEANVKARDKVIANLSHQVDELTQKLEAQEFEAREAADRAELSVVDAQAETPDAG